MSVFLISTPLLPVFWISLIPLSSPLDLTLLDKIIISLAKTMESPPGPDGKNGGGVPEKSPVDDCWEEDSAFHVPPQRLSSATA